MQFARFVWSKPTKDSELIDLYALKSNREGIPPLSGGVVTDATQTYDMSNKPAESMQMNGKGAKI